jgi:hypothetical protein
MSDIKTLTNDLDESQKQLESISDKWATARAEHDKCDEMKKIKLAFSCEKYTGSEAKKKNMGLLDPEYQVYIEDDKFQADKNYYLIDAKKNALEIRIEILKTYLMKSYV